MVFIGFAALHHRAAADRYFLHAGRPAREVRVMPFVPVVLWTDALVWLLVAAVIGFTFYVRRHEHLVAPWRRVAHSTSGMAASRCWPYSSSIGLLDSLHFRPRLATQAPAAPGGLRRGRVERARRPVRATAHAQREDLLGAARRRALRQGNRWSSPTGGRRASTRASSTAARISKNPQERFGRRHDPAQRGGCRWRRLVVDRARDTV